MKHLLLPVMMATVGLSAFAASDLVPGSPTDLSLKFYIQNGKGEIKGQFKAPTTDDYYDPRPLTERIVIDVARSCWSLGEYDVPVAHIENVIPGNSCSFTDNEIPVYGYDYTYTVTASNSKGESGWGSSASESAYAGIRVAMPEFVNIATADKGASPLTFTVRANATDEEGNDLGMPLTTLTLTYAADDDDETSDVVGTIENPESGKEYELTFEAIDGISYDFYLVAECAYGRSEKQSRSIFVGEDTPAAPTELTLAPMNDGAMITWTAPAAGRHNGWIDPAEIRYRVERVISYNNRTLLADNLTECEYFDSCDDLTTLTSLSYTVTACNALGEGGYASSETIIVGPSAKIPFEEHFNTSSGWSVKPDNIWTEVPEDYNWSFSTSTYASGGLPGVLGDAKNEEGYAYCSGYGNPENRLVSTPISLANAKYPVLTFWYGARPDAANLLAVGFTAEGEEEVVEEFAIAEDYAEYAVPDDAPVWVRRVVAMPQIAGKTASIVFNAKCISGADNENLCIDEILLDDYPPVELFSYNFKDGNGSVTWTAPANSTGEATKYDVEIDGEAYGETDIPEIALTGVEDRDYMLKVRAWYGDIPSCWSESFIFNPLTTGILTVGADGSRTEYFDLTGTRRSTFAPGEILIRRTINPDGSVSTRKIKM